MITQANIKIAIIGLGYVGLPLAVEFAKQYTTIGYDVDSKRILDLLSGHDITNEIDCQELKLLKNLTLTNDSLELASCNVYVVTVPTPVDKHKKPDFEPLINSSKTVGRYLSPGNIVIYESTVYPGATEEICAPILSETSGLHFLISDKNPNNGFYVGYSPERINPGDKVHRLTTICKVTSGSTPRAATFIDELYRSIINAGTHLAPSIKVAEAAKVIENTQRDVNIALMNELSQIFERVGIDTHDVLDAAKTKWNFLPFTPGLVGGHCIGVDPYYLTHKAIELGYQPSIIPSSRLLNEGMGNYVASRTIKLMARHNIEIVNSRILILGLSFKENCPDLRNTRVIDIIESLREYHTQIDVYDPWVGYPEAEQELGIELIDTPKVNTYGAIIIAVGHNEFIKMGPDKIKQLGKSGCVVFDVKSIFARTETSDRL